YAFSQVFFGKTVAPAPGGGFQYTDPPIRMPTVFPFQAKPGADQTAFISALTTLLTQLQACWTSGSSIGTAVATMTSLRTAGVALIQAGIRPQFSFQP